MVVQPEPASRQAVVVRSRDVAIGACATSAIVHAYLVTDHWRDEPLLALAFAAGAGLLALVAYALSRPSLRFAPGAAAALLGALIVAYPAVSFVGDQHVDALGIATKLVEAIGIFATVRAVGDERPPLASFDVIVGFFVAILLISALGHTH